MWFFEIIKQENTFISTTHNIDYLTKINNYVFSFKLTISTNLLLHHFIQLCHIKLFYPTYACFIIICETNNSVIKMLCEYFVLEYDFSNRLSANRNIRLLNVKYRTNVTTGLSIVYFIPALERRRYSWKFSTSTDYSRSFLSVDTSKLYR